MQILLYSNVPDDLEFFQAAGATAGIHVVPVRSIEEYCSALQAVPQSISVIDGSSAALYKAFEDGVSSRLGLFSEMLDPNRIFFVGSIELFECFHLVKSGLMGGYITRTYNDENQAQIGRILKTSVVNRAFGIENFFGPNVKTQNIPITHSQQKLPIVDSIKTYLTKIGFKSRAAAMISTATDELLMNAMYDAPVDELGKQIFAATPRTTPLELSARSAVELKLSFDGQILGITVSDQFGSIDRKTILDHITKSYESAEYKVKTNKAGAGLGLSNVYRNCGGMVYTCESGHRTEATLFFKKTDSVKDFKDQFRFFASFMYLS